MNTASYQSELLNIAMTSGLTDRHNNRYSPTTMERITVLQPEGENPDMKWSYPTLPALMEAAEKYDGNVTTIWGTKYERVKVVDEGPINFFAWQPDGTYVRSDKFAKVSSLLEHMQPDWSGVVATALTGPVSFDGPTSDTHPVAFNWSEHFPGGVGQWKVSEMPIGEGGVQIIVSTGSTPTRGQFSCEGSNLTPPQNWALGLRIGDAVLSVPVVTTIVPSIIIATGEPADPNAGMLPSDTVIGWLIKPEKLQRSAKGIANLTVELKMLPR